MITSHPFNQIERWGFTTHGLAWRTGIAGGDSFYKNDAGTFPLTNFSAPLSSDVHLLRVPGVPALDIPEEEFAAELSQGRTWQNYALLSGSSFMLAGRELYGWIYCDPDGVRWLVKTAITESGYASFNASSGFGLTLTFTRFGEFGGDPQTFSLSVSAAAHGQPVSGFSSDPTNYVSVGSISSDGSKVILNVFGLLSPAVSFAPQGFLLLELSGSGPATTGAISVLKSRAQTLGTAVLGSVTVQKKRIRWRFNITEGDTSYTATPAGIEVDQPGGGLAYQQTVIIDSKQTSAEQQGQVVAIVFDDEDRQVEFTLDRKVEHFTQYGDPVVAEQSGLLTSVGKPSSGGAWTNGEARVVVRQSRDHWRSFTMTLKRDGLPVWSNAIRWRSVGLMERSYVTIDPYIGNFSGPHYIWLFTDGEPGMNGYASMTNSLEMFDGPITLSTDEVSMLLPATANHYTELAGSDVRQLVLQPWPTTAWRLSCRRMSRQVVSLHRAPPSEPVDYPVSARYSCMAAAAALITDALESPSDITLSASYEPVRREIATRDDGLTVCWI